MKNYILFIIGTISIVLITVLALFALSSCDPGCVKESGYFTKWGSLYYQPKGSFKGDEVKVEGVDLYTFETIDNTYAKDKNYLYFLGLVVEDVDLNTFEFLDSPFSRDKGHIFYYGKKIENADASTFKVVAKNYGVDKNHVYTGTVLGPAIIEGADPISFEIIDKRAIVSEYSNDANHVYYKGRLISDADASTFQLLENNYSKDKNHVYHLDYFPEAEYKYQVNIVQDVDPATFAP